MGLITEKSKPLIAIIDDDESVCRAIERLVRSLGMKGDTFTSSQEFIEMVETTSSLNIDCIILDVQMPSLNGLEVQERLARSGSLVPVIFITAHDDAGTCERALAAGAIAFLRKPFNDELLVKTLDDALKHGAGEKENE